MAVPISCCTSTCPDTEIINIPGLAGLDGAAGAAGADGVNAFSTIDAGETDLCPAVGVTVTVTVDVPDWMAVGQVVFVESVGYFRVTAVGATDVNLYYLEYAGNTNTGAALNGLKVSPGGVGSLGFVITTSPEGALAAAPGAICLNSTDDSVWIKKTGVGNTGWLNIIACLIFFMSLCFSFSAPPVLRNYWTTNDQAKVYSTNLDIGLRSWTNRAPAMTNAINVVVATNNAVTNIVTSFITYSNNAFGGSNYSRGHWTGTGSFTNILLGGLTNATVPVGSASVIDSWISWTNVADPNVQYRIPVYK